MNRNLIIVAEPLFKVQPFVPVTLPGSGGGVSHARLHNMDSENDHAATIEADRDKIPHSNAITGKWELIATPPAGSGTENYIPIWLTGGKTLGNSPLYKNGDYLGVGNDDASSALDISGDLKIRTVPENTDALKVAVIGPTGVIGYVLKSTLGGESNTYYYDYWQTDGYIISPVAGERIFTTINQINVQAIYGRNLASGGIGVAGLASTGGVFAGTEVCGLRAEIYTSVTNEIKTVIINKARGGATGAVGLGARNSFQLFVNSAYKDSGYFENVLTSSTSSAESAKFQWQLIHSGTIGTKLELSSSGDLDTYGKFRARGLVDESSFAQIAVVDNDGNFGVIAKSIFATTNTTYSHAAVTSTGGALLRLAGSDSSNDDVKFAEGTGIQISYTDANTITISNSRVSLWASMGGQTIRPYTLNDVIYVQTNVTGYAAITGFNENAIGIGVYAETYAGTGLAALATTGLSAKMIKKTSTTPDTYSEIVRYERDATGGTPAPGLGLYQSYYIDSLRSGIPEVARMGVINTDVTNLAETAKFQIQLINSGTLATCMELAPDGLSIEGYLNTKPIATPATAEGRIYFDTTDKHFYGYNGTTWKQLDN